MKRFVTKVSALSCEILIRELNNNFIQESENIPARASRHPIYISISDVRKGLSGKYNFHSLQDRVSVFIRDGEKIDGLNNLHPYYLQRITNLNMNGTYNHPNTSRRVTQEAF